MALLISHLFVINSLEIVSVTTLCGAKPVYFYIKLTSFMLLVNL